MMKKLFLYLVTLLSSFSLSADIDLPQLFGNNMILQQKQKNTIWGWAKPGSKITVKASWGANETAKSNIEGQWKVFLDTPSHGTGHSLSISGDNDTVEVKMLLLVKFGSLPASPTAVGPFAHVLEKEDVANDNYPRPSSFVRRANSGTNP